LYKAKESFCVMFVANNQSPEVVQPTYRALDFPAATEAAEATPVLGARFRTIPPVRTNEFNASPSAALAQRVAVGREIINQIARQTAKLAVFEKRFNQRYLMRAGTGDVNSPGQARPFGEHHDFGAFAALRFTDARPPFFAGENVPSAKDSSVRSRPARWSFRKSRDQALAKAPLRNHSLNRRQQVAGEGKHFGRSFHLAPVRSTQQIPSKQRRASHAGRPPFGDGLGVGKRSAIIAHCLSVSSCWGNDP
jgi:hypothetical protein